MAPLFIDTNVFKPPPGGCHFCILFLTCNIRVDRPVLFSLSLASLFYLFIDLVPCAALLLYSLTLIDLMCNLLYMFSSLYIVFIWLLTIKWIWLSSPFMDILALTFQRWSQVIWLARLGFLLWCIKQSASIICLNSFPLSACSKRRDAACRPLFHNLLDLELCRFHLEFTYSLQ